MRTRVAIALPGLAAIVWGAILAVRFAVHSWHNGRAALLFYLGGAIGHDVVIAPIVGVVGLLVSTRVPVAWRTPVRVGSAMTGVLGLLAVPALWRRYAGQPNPGLDDRPYAVGLILAVVAVWLVTIAGGLVRQRRIKRDAPSGRVG